MSRAQAVTFTAVERAELLDEAEDLRPLEPAEITGPTVASLISPGTELAGYQGQWSGAKFPLVPGYAAVFQVAAAGSQVDSFKPGDLAFCMGGHRSVQRCRQEQAVRVPDGLSPQVAPFARLMCVTMSTLTTTTARPPSLVLITGLGIVGHLAARIFDVCGYAVIGIDPSPARREIARRSGARDVRPAVPLDDPDVAGQAALVVETSGHEQAALDACKAVRKRGEVVLVAAMWQRRTDLLAYDLLHAIFNHYAVVRSGWEWELPLHPSDFRVNSIYGNIAGALRWLAEGRVKVDGLARTVPPGDAQQAYQQLLHRPEQGLTVLFDWTKVEA